MSDYFDRIMDAVGKEWEEITQRSMSVPCPHCGAAPLQLCHGTFLAKAHYGVKMHATRRTMYLKILKYSSKEDLRDPDRYSEIVMWCADGPVTLPDEVAARYGLPPQRGLEDV